MQQTTNVNDSVHNCFFCYERRRASLEEEISFFELRLGSNRTLIQLLALRREYRNWRGLPVRWSAIRKRSSLTSKPPSRKSAVA
jgi:hypothetical protein